jgi:hypothetical protein
MCVYQIIQKYNNNNKEEKTGKNKEEKSYITGRFGTEPEAGSGFGSGRAFVRNLLLLRAVLCGSSQTSMDARVSLLVSSRAMSSSSVELLPPASPLLRHALVQGLGHRSSTQRGRGERIRGAKRSLVLQSIAEWRAQERAPAATGDPFSRRVGCQS